MGSRSGHIGSMVEEVATAVEMRIRALVVDPVSKMPVVILQQAEEGVFLPIWIGVCEANAIALELEGVKTPRPMTHDLLTSVILEAGFLVESICIHSLKDSVFLAAIQVRDREGQAHEIDARPSDAIALALRAKVPVLVSQDVLAEAQVAEGSNEDTLRLILERLRPEDLGEYEM
jgi:bifunctional DNase/RNase